MGIRTVTRIATHFECPNKEQHIAEDRALWGKEKGGLKAIDDSIFLSRDVRPTPLFCRRCGVRLVVVDKEYHEEQCETCGTPVVDSFSPIGRSTFCPQCGARLK